MGEEKRNIPIPKEFKQTHYATQPEVLLVKKQKKVIYIGIPKENNEIDKRVALVPASVATLIARGHRVVIETGAGDAASYPDSYFSEVGADIAYSKEQVYKSDIIIKVAPPTLEEIDFFQPNQIIISPLQLPIVTGELINKMNKKRVIAMAMEYIMDEHGSYPVVRIMSEIAGQSAIINAAELLTNSKEGKGILLGGISGVPSAKVVILGAGVVAEYASRIALALGADVRVFDNNIPKLMRLKSLVGSSLNTSSFTPRQLEKDIINAEVVIGAVHSSNGRTPLLVSEDIVVKMKEGAVIIDVSIDQGGCFETSRVTTLKKRTFVKHGVTHFCLPNIASTVPRTSSIAVSNIMAPILLNIGEHGIDHLIDDFPGLRHGVYSYKGCLTNAYIGQKFGIKSTDLDLLIASRL